MAVKPFQAFTSKLGIAGSNLKGKGYSYAPMVTGDGQTPGQLLFDKIGERKSSGQDLYTQNKQENTNRLANDLVNKSAGLSFDEWGKPELELGNFRDALGTQLQGVGQRGKLALQTAEAKNAWNQAKTMQDLGQYQFSGQFSITGSGTDIPGASSGNAGAKAASMAMQVAKNHTAYVWGGNSLSNGVDCSGLVQQIYKKLGINVPRTTYDQAKNGKRVSVANIRPGDLVFYRPGSNGPEHVGIYVGNGKVVHAANSRLGVITSNLNNSNGSPLMVLRPY